MKGYREKDVASNAWNVRAKDLELLKTIEIMPFFLHSAPLPPLSPLKLVQPRKFFYLRSNERRLRSYFETLITLLQTLPFHLLQATFLHETGLITATTNAENLRQYKIRFSLISEQTLSFATSPNMVREAKHLSRNFKQIA